MRRLQKEPRDKPFFCHDENLEFAALIKECNQGAMFISAIKLMKRAGAKDPQIISECDNQDIHILTKNTRHFRNPPENIKIGIICIGKKLDKEFIKKLKSLFLKHRKHSFYYQKIFLIDDHVTMFDRVANTRTILQ